MTPSLALWRAFPPTTLADLSGALTLGENGGQEGEDGAQEEDGGQEGEDGSQEGEDGSQEGEDGGQEGERGLRMKQTNVHSY